MQWFLPRWTVNPIFFSIRATSVITVSLYNFYRRTLLNHVLDSLQTCFAFHRPGRSCLIPHTTMLSAPGSVSPPPIVYTTNCGALQQFLEFSLLITNIWPEEKTELHFHTFRNLLPVLSNVQIFFTQLSQLHKKDFLLTILMNLEDDVQSQFYKPDLLVNTYFYYL